MGSSSEVRVRVGSTEAAFEAFYRARYGTVLAFVIRRVADRELAREITADVLHLAWSSFTAEAPPSTAWLLSVARNRVGDSYRRLARDRRLVAALQGEAAAASGPPLADDRVRSALDSLPAGSREVLAMTYWDGLSASEAAAVLGISPGAMWVRLHRARRAFAAAWTREGNR